MGSSKTARGSGKAKKAERMAKMEAKRAGDTEMKQIVQYFMSGWLILGVVVAAYAFKTGQLGFGGADLEDGVKKTIVSPGDGINFPQEGQNVTVHYTAKVIETGKVFDTTRMRGPMEFEVGGGKILVGLDIAVRNMSLGEQAQVNVSSNLAFGARGIGEGETAVPPNADVEFLMQLVGIGDNKIPEPEPPAAEEEDDEDDEDDEEDEEEEETQWVDDDGDKKGEEAASPSEEADEAEATDASA